MNLLQLSHHCISVVLLHESHLGPFPLETVRSIDDVKPGFLIGKRNIARSVTVIIPTTASFTSTIGSLRILFFNIISTAFSIVVAGSAVMSGCEAKLSSTRIPSYEISFSHYSKCFTILSYNNATTLSSVIKSAA